MENAAKTLKPEVRATFKRIHELLKEATENGCLDELAAFVHPDVINNFCDAISDALIEPYFSSEYR